MDRYSVILADPPWPFETYSEKGKGRSPEQHYPTMSIDEIAALPVGDLAADDCALFLWTVKWLSGTLNDQVAAAWGFRYATRAFIWVKLNLKADNPFDLHIGQGYYTRSGGEICNLYVKGKMAVDDRGMPEIIEARVRRHSAKPDEQYDRIERLYPEAHRIELFARQRRPGWAAWGNEVESDITLEGYKPHPKKPIQTCQQLALMGVGNG